MERRPALEWRRLALERRPAALCGTEAGAEVRGGFDGRREVGRSAGGGVPLGPGGGAELGRGRGRRGAGRWVASGLGISGRGRDAERTEESPSRGLGEGWRLGVGLWWGGEGGLNETLRSDI